MKFMGCTVCSFVKTHTAKEASLAYVGQGCGGSDSVEMEILVQAEAARPRHGSRIKNESGWTRLNERRKQGEEPTTNSADFAQE